MADKITQNALNLCDNVIMTIHCEYCDNEFGDFAGEVYDCAEAADAEGWVVNKAGKAKCPECVKRMKRKKK